MTKNGKAITLAVLSSGLSLLLLSMSVFQFMLLFWFFFAGVALSFILFRPGYEVPNLIAIGARRDAANQSKTTSMKQAFIKCFICGDENCKRQKPEQELHSIQPWIGISVTEKVDHAVAEFLNVLLQKYVWNWYRKLSEDDAFVHELKISLRYCAASLYRRIVKVDLPNFILTKFLAILMLHANICIAARNSGCTNEAGIINFYGKKLHRCMKSRRTEVAYLRAICDEIFVYLLPDSVVNSRVVRTLLREVLASNVLLPGIDAIDDPDWVNKILLVYFDDQPPKPAPGPPSPMVPFLDQFASRETSMTSSGSSSLLQVDLPQIIRAQDMLYQFMSFLKTRSAVHYLQFCLTVDDFNRRCLAPEQDEEQQRKLHREAREIFAAYCDESSPTFIHFDPTIIADLRHISSGRWEEVSRLRTSTPLFHAYDHVYNLLENIYCPMFYQSEMYYKMVCGDRAPTKKASQWVQSSTTRRSNNKSTRRKLPRKHRTIIGENGDVRNNLDSNLMEKVEVDGNNSLTDDGELDDDEKSQNQFLLDDDIIDDVTMTSTRSNGRLSTWRLSIPRLELKRDVTHDVTSHERFHFCIEVIDIQKDEMGQVEKWKVSRQHNEFYALENMLTEFHGSLHPISLPPKKIFSKTLDYLNSKRDEFEKFLKDLITNPTLQKSELLYDFLLPDRSGAVLFNRRMPRIGNIFRRVPNKLIKEKGRHIEGFLQSLAQSCEASKPRPGKHDSPTDQPEILMDRKLHSETYNAEEFADEDVMTSPSDHIPAADDVITFDGIFSYLNFLCAKVFRVKRWMLRLLLVLRVFFRKTLEPYVLNHVRCKMDVYKQEHHVINLISLFSQVVFEKKLPPSAEEKKARCDQSLQAFKDFIPRQVVKLIGRKQHKEGCETLFGVLQHPKLNKQLGYLLLDAVLVEIFPELTDA